MTACGACGTAHVVLGGGDDDQPYVRNVCRCEAPRPCARARCKGAVVQAVLELDGETVDQLRCHVHGVTDFLDDLPPPPAPRPGGVPPPERSKARVRVEAPRATPEAPETRTPDEIYAALEADVQTERDDRKTRLKCTHCGREHVPAQRPWRRMTDAGGRCVLRSHCPACDQDGYVAIF